MNTFINAVLITYCSIFGICFENGCRYLNYANNNYIVCSYNVETVNVRLFLKNNKGNPYAYLGRLNSSLESPALMLMNGGMYHHNLGAVGLYIENGIESQRISTKGGWGNFHLLPNGVFWGKDGELFVTETNRFIQMKNAPDFATQSGPMLVIDGKLHPRFLQDSDSRKVRNGVGVSKDGKRVHFVISKRPVTFWEFGTLFKDELLAHNALFLDGTVSAIQSTDHNKASWRALGPMIGVFKR